MSELVSELENMVANSLYTVTEQEPSSGDIERWQTLFSLSRTQAVEYIQLHRNDIARSRVTDELWDIVREEQENLGYDRDSFEYALINGGFSKKPVIDLKPHDSSSTMYTVKLDGPLATAEMVKDAIQLSQIPDIAEGAGEAGSAVFCKINGSARRKLLTWLGTEHPMFRPTIIHLSKSPKHLSSHTMAPMLGKDTTLPQHRPDSSDSVPLPSQDQYPMWYFFYGNLAKPLELQQRLNLVEPPGYTPAYVQGDKIESWRGQYKALVDASPECHETGGAYLVQSKEEEEILQFYETEKYEVVRCIIHMEGGLNVNGLVFRFAK